MQQQLLILKTISEHLDSKVIVSESINYVESKIIESPEHAIRNGWRLMGPPQKVEYYDGIFIQWWFEKIV